MGLGRPRLDLSGQRFGALYDDERVHHRNGNRSDNRPENLELWSVKTPLPPGERTADIVEYCVGMLRRYAPEKLR